MEQRSTAANVLRAPKNLGMMTAMNNFGIRSSSIAHLKSFPVYRPLMDWSVVERPDKDPENRVVVSAAIGLAHALGLELAAQGVETAEELDELRSMGCDIVQGHYRQATCSAEKITKLLAAGSNPS